MGRYPRDDINTSCVNPEHLEAVTPRMNVLRSNNPMSLQAKQTHCIHGHPLSGYNLMITKKGRQCRTCALRLMQEHRIRKKTILIQR